VARQGSRYIIVLISIGMLMMIGAELWSQLAPSPFQRNRSIGEVSSPEALAEAYEGVLAQSTLRTAGAGIAFSLGIFLYLRRWKRMWMAASVLVALFGYFAWLSGRELIGTPLIWLAILSEAIAAACILFLLLLPAAHRHLEKPSTRS